MDSSTGQSEEGPPDFITDQAPWLGEEFSKLMDRHLVGKLPHGIMLEGVQGMGKSGFARYLSQTLLCTSQKSQPCTKCNSCVQLLAGSHADFRTVGLLEDKTSIGVDSVREFASWLRLTPNEGSYRVGIIDPADSLTAQAANSLLKTLEEPAPGRLLLLVCEKPESLPLTVASRCQRINLSVTERSLATGWLASKGLDDPEMFLELGQGAPHAALALADPEAIKKRAAIIQAWSDILNDKASIEKSISAISDVPTRDLLQAFASFVADTLRLSVMPSAKIRNSDIRELLYTLHETLPNESWFTLYDELLSLRRSDSASFKTHTVLEGIFAAIKLNQPA